MNIGFHISIKDIHYEEINTYQIFVSGPMNQHFNNIDVDKYLKYRMYVHSSYVSHLTSKHKIEEMKRTMEFNGIGIVVHYGIIELDVFRKQLKIVAEEMHKNNITCRMILEMKASKPNENTYETVEKFNNLMNVLDEVDPLNKYFSICFDTSHFHACGISLTTYDDCEKYFNALNYKRIILFHLNGNTNAKGSGKDQHNEVGGYQDMIWGNDKSGLEFIVNFAVKNKIDIILERHHNDIDEINFIKSLIKL